MIHNTCIYGTVSDGAGELILDSTVSMKYIKYDFSKVLEAEYANTTGAYQFNLGNTNMLTLDVATSNQDVVILSNSTNRYSCKVVLDGNKWHYLHDIIDDSSGVATSDEANASDESTNIITRSITLNEYSDSLYSYYKVEYNGGIVYEIVSSKLDYLPANTGEHKVTHYAVNTTTGDITKVERLVDVQQDKYRVESVDYIFYTKKKKVLRAELPKYVTDTLILADGWYYENGKLVGIHNKLSQLEMDYYNGKVIVRGYIGDILDY